MARHRTMLVLLAHFVSSGLLIDVTQITVYPKNGSVYGVFHASLSTGYGFNASVARDVCDQLGVTIADKSQVENARSRGFETCRFGWIDEQIAVVPRIQSKESCGKGKVGIVPWRAILNTSFDVFCFNLTAYEAQVSEEDSNPSTTVTPTIHTSEAHFAKMVQTTPSGSREDLRSSSSSLSSVNHSPVNVTSEYSSGHTTAGGLIALGMTFFAFLLLTMAAVCYFKKHGMGRWNKSQKQTTDTEICVKTNTKSQAEVKTQHKTSNTNDVSVTIKLENECRAPY